MTAVHNINDNDDDIMDFKLLFNVTFLVRERETENQMLKTSANLPLLTEVCN